MIKSSALVKRLFSKTFYMRKLPDKQIRLASEQGKAIFREALQQGNMECYFPLAEQFTTQMEPSTCGPTSLVMVLNALGVDPRKQWKGIWRWYNEQNLNMMTKEILKRGLHLESWTHIAKHNYLDVSTFYYPDEIVKRKSQQRKQGMQTKQPQVDCNVGCEQPNQFKTASFQTFKDCMLSSVRRDGFILTLNHSRKKMQQTGTGHYSPIGGYNAKRDLVLMLDVARFKYPSYWCETRQLFESLSQIDQDSQLPRGFVLVSRKLESRSQICNVGLDYSTIKQFHKFLYGLRGSPQNLTLIIDQLLNSFNPLFRSTIVYFLFELDSATNQEKEQLYKSIKQQPLHKKIHQILLSNQAADLKNKDYKQVQLLINEFTMGKFSQIVYLLARSLPQQVLQTQQSNHNPHPHPPHHRHHIHHTHFPQSPSNEPLIQKYVRTMKRCFGIFREHSKNSEYF